MEKVFLGNLSGDINESCIARLLDDEGILYNNISMKSKFAFVTVKDKCTVDEMVKKLNGKPCSYTFLMLSLTLKFMHHQMTSQIPKFRMICKIAKFLPSKLKFGPEV